MTPAYDLTKVLDECRIIAKSGFDSASKACHGYAVCLNHTAHYLDEQIHKTQNQPERYNKLMRFLQSMREPLLQAKQQLASEQQKLDELYKHQARFSIALFGRTMAGKSTLREILTHGNGDTIGKGKQRTTLTVNHYSWQNLDITDMPGIAAFEGKDDEIKAFNAAKSADLILFMMTDDGPQKDEADELKKLVEIGKPILFLINLKKSVSDNLKLARLDIQDCFDEAGRGGIRNQFLEYGKSFGQNWEPFPFIYVHLLSALKAQHEPDPKKADVLYQLSHLDALIEQIMVQVINKGRFYKIKTFTDTIAPVIAGTENELFQMGCKARSQITQNHERIDCLNQIKNDFIQNGNRSIQNRVKQIRLLIMNSIPDFVDDNYQNKDWDDAWETHLKTLKVQARCRQEISEFIAKCQNKLENTSIKVNYKQTFTCDASDTKYLSLSKIHDWGFVGGILSTGATLASLFVPAIKPFYPLMMSIGSFLGHKDYKSKVRDAKQELKKCLITHVNRIGDNVESIMKRVLKMISIKLTKHIKSLKYKHEVLSGCVHEFIDSAIHMHKVYKTLNMHMIQIGCDDLEIQMDDIKMAGRIPGTFCALWCRHQNALSEADKIKLETRLSEKIMEFPVPPVHTEIITQLLSQYIQISPVDMITDKDYPVICIPYSGESDEIRNRISLAQQICQMGILENRS